MVVRETLGESADAPDDKIADFGVGLGVERGKRGFQGGEGGGGKRSAGGRRIS